MATLPLEIPDSRQCRHIHSALLIQHADPFAGQGLDLFLFALIARLILCTKLVSFLLSIPLLDLLQREDKLLRGEEVSFGIPFQDSHSRPV